MAESVMVLMTLLSVGFLATRVAQWFRLPHSVFLVILGLMAGYFIRGWAGMGIDRLVSSFPDIILFILLPPLVFESAYNLDFNDFRKDAAPIAMLAAVALLISTALIGFGLHRGFGLPLLPCLVFGALISATDPVAVVSLFKEIGAPKRLNTLVEGESLLNDGTAIVLFRVLVAATAAPSIDSSLIGAGMLQFLEVAVGGAIVGFAVAGITSALLKITTRSAAAQLGITVAAAYLSFLIADHFLHVSGVMATLAIGMRLGTRARLELNKEALHGMHYIWEFLALSANTVVFLAVGISVDLGAVLQGLKFIPFTLVIVYLARAAAVSTTIPLVNAFRWAPPISFAYQTILLWGGLRGGLALGLVLMLPVDFPYKDLFLSLATAVVLATLFINALTIKQAMHWLGLDRLDHRERQFFERAIALVHDAVLEPMFRAASVGGLSHALVSHHRQNAQAAVSAMGAGPGGTRLADPASDQQFGVKKMLLTERGYYDEKLEDSVLSKEAYQCLVHLVTERLQVYALEGNEGLRNFSWFEQTVQERVPFFRRLAPKSQHSRVKELTVRLEILLHLVQGLEHALAQSSQPEIRDIAENWLKRANRHLGDFFRLYPHYGAAVQTFYLANTIHARSLSMVNHLLEAAIISGSVAARVREVIEAQHQAAQKEGKELLNPSLEYLLSRVPLFLGLPDETIRQIARDARRLTCDVGRPVVKAGEEGNSFFLVTTGILEVDHGSGDKGRRPQLFAGDFFGEMSLLFAQPRNATVTPVVASELLEIGQEGFHTLMEKFPEVRAKVQEIASQRGGCSEAASASATPRPL